MSSKISKAAEGIYLCSAQKTLKLREKIIEDINKGFYSFYPNLNEIKHH